jgi:hypothetical protein
LIGRRTDLDAWRDIARSGRKRVIVDVEIFAAAWRAEIAEVPEFTERTIHIVAGLLLPIWKRLPEESTRVYPTGERKVATYGVVQPIARELGFAASALCTNASAIRSKARAAASP